MDDNIRRDYREWLEWVASLSAPEFAQLSMEVRERIRMVAKAELDKYRD